VPARFASLHLCIPAWLWCLALLLQALCGCLQQWNCCKPATHASRRFAAAVATAAAAAAGHLALSMGSSLTASIVTAAGVDRIGALVGQMGGEVTGGRRCCSKSIAVSGKCTVTSRTLAHVCWSMKFCISDVVGAACQHQLKPSMAFLATELKVYIE
jgi:hypothetical protein